MPMERAEDLMPLQSVPDLRGTPTQDASGVGIGRLWGALAEADTGLLRYLDVQLEGRPRHVLVPIGHARLREHQGEPTVRLRAALLEDLEAVPAFEPDAAALDDPFERTLLEAHGRAYHGERYYAHPAYDHRGLYAGAHPIVSTTEVSAPGEAATLQPLSELAGYGVARGEPDIRTWAMTGLEQAPLGVVVDLIVEIAAEKVRYVVLEPVGGTRRVLLPVGFLDLDTTGRLVRAPALAPADVTALPTYVGGSVDRPVEAALRAALLERLRGARRYLLPDFSPGSLAERD